MDRRLFLKRAASLIAAPAIVPLQALMPIRGPSLICGPSLLWGDTKIAAGSIYAGDVVWLYDTVRNLWKRIEHDTPPQAALGVSLIGANSGEILQILTNGHYRVA